MTDRASMHVIVTVTPLEDLPGLSRSSGRTQVRGSISNRITYRFAEIIPQSLATRYGLYFGAKMSGLVRVLLWTLVRPLPGWPFLSSIDPEI